MTPLRTLLTTLLLLSSAAPLAAQVREKIPPPEFKRETVVDENGLQQWVVLDARCEPCQGRGKRTCDGCAQGPANPICTECDGTKTARCRTCVGTKKVLDPIVTLGCPYCRASGWYNCAQCNGFGAFKVGDNDQSCGACKKKGRYPCSVCDGHGHLPAVRVKKKAPGEAKLKDLVGMREVLQACLADMEAFEPLERASKSQKALEEIVKKPSKKLPPLKDMLGLLDTALKGLTKAGSSYQGYEERKTHQFLLFKDRSVYLLQYQIRVLDQCMARAEFNESVTGK